MNTSLNQKHGKQLDKDENVTKKVVVVVKASKEIPKLLLCGLSLMLYNPGTVLPSWSYFQVVQEIVRVKSKRNVPFRSELHQQPLHEFIDGGDNSRAICSKERIAREGVAKPFIDVNLNCCDELVYDGSNRHAMDSSERRAGEGAAERFTDLGFRLFYCFLIVVVLPVIMAWSIGMGFY